MKTTLRILNSVDYKGPDGRGTHSSTFRLNVSDFCRIGGAFRGFLGQGCVECMLCQKRPRLS